MQPISNPAMRLPALLLGISMTIVSSAIVVTGIMTACSGDATGLNNPTSSRLAFTTSASTTSGVLAAVVPVTNGGHTLDLTAVRLTIARAELKRAKTDACPGDHDADDDHPAQVPSTQTCGEFKIGPTIVNLPLDGNLVSIPANTIPAGTFREFELRVVQVELQGTFDGKPFDAVVLVNTRSEVDFSTPLVVADSQPTAITVNVPVSTWLVNSDGSLVDPNTLATTPSVAARVMARISASFRAFADRNQDGKDDHDGRE